MCQVLMSSSEDGGFPCLHLSQQVFYTAAVATGPQKPNKAGFIMHYAAICLLRSADYSMEPCQHWLSPPHICGSQQHIMLGLALGLSESMTGTNSHV